MGRMKIEADRTNKSVLKSRVESLEKKVRLMEAVVANLVRGVAGKAQLEKFMQQPEATVTGGFSESKAVALEEELT